MTGCEVYLKVEGANPTAVQGPGMTVAVSMAAAHGVKAVICASRGTPAPAPPRTPPGPGSTCAVLVPRGKIALGKLAQALVHGARAAAGGRQLDDGLDPRAQFADDHPVALVNWWTP